MLHNRFRRVEFITDRGVVVVALGGRGIGIQSLCNTGTFSESFLTSEVTCSGFAPEKLASLIECLRAAAIAVTT